MASDFIAYFTGREGSTALLGALGRVRGVEVLRQGRRGLEPFDQHSTHDVDDATLGAAIRSILARDPGAFDQYRPIGRRPIIEFDIGAAKSIGFKMRPALNKRRLEFHQQLLADTGAQPFVLFRRDHVSKVLGRLHDHAAGVAHAQFKKPENRFKGSVTIDVDDLATRLAWEKKAEMRKERFGESLRGFGPEPIFLDYEDFLEDPIAQLEKVLTHIGLIRSKRAIRAAYKGFGLEKVHSKDWRDFVANPDEVAAILREQGYDGETSA